MSMNRLRKHVSALGILLGLALAPQAHAVVVIYNSDGSCKVCIGSASACAKACPARAVSLTGYDQLSLSANGAQYVGDSLTLSDVGGGQGTVLLMAGGSVKFRGRLALDQAVVTDLANGNANTLAALNGLTCQ
ncbi:hypothetical protein ACLESO_13575 [Pyxidicoccus sp. 3LG]